LGHHGWNAESGLDAVETEVSKEAIGLPVDESNKKYGPGFSAARFFIRSYACCRPSTHSNQSAPRAGVPEKMSYALIFRIPRVDGAATKLSKQVFIACDMNDEWKSAPPC
jgi:hypothetical protein